ncbi:MAG TPA: YncE family protein [Woeseiaceae bacterium]|nr:YncE family protein [Woeseiaceae bacterium]
MALQAQPLAYVTNQASEDRLWVIDTETNELVDTVTLEDIPSRVAITPDGSLAYVTMVVDGDFNQLSGDILYSSIPSSPVFMGSLSKASASGSLFTNKVEVIETATNTIITTVMTEESAPFDIAMTPDGRFAYVSHLGPAVSVIDTAANEVIETVPTDGSGLGLAVTPDGAYVYVATSSADVVSVIETATNTVIVVIEVGETPSAIAITPDGAFVYVTNQESDTISQIEIASNTVVATQGVGQAPGSIAITPDGAFAYVTNQLSNDVSVIATGTNAVVATIPVGDTPIDTAITSDGKLVYVTNIFSESISVIDTASNTVIGTAPAGFLSEGIAITPEVMATLTIDIKPGNEQNRLNPASRGGIWIAIQSEGLFDVLQININTVGFGPLAASAVGQGVRDVNKDGLPDLLLRFKVEQTGIGCGDTEATLIGETLLGQQFAGTDVLETVGCQNQDRAPPSVLSGDPGR